ncbi:YfcE family phosphodiesterase [Mesobacillus subterraneus]|uniref:metallophosphoesterase family protein n=1 Tax=Mesobacillus subterraneus TaxID=285983 RepID=UPI002041E201|nr:YfcE family phosphodiesterase [Mesobacillus subterraneus]MCM3665245.1 YfcE family phosphodiesterase [Mesobacillus subterraneus]MCM3684258.1 YfcE family phosphodiesterase [Mesobacillus subterraneus]
MKIAFISDIHGNATALEAVLEDIKERNVDNVYVLGDICYRGTEPRRSVELVRKLNTAVIKGNADEWIVRGIQKGEVPDPALEIMNKERGYTLSRMDRESVDYLYNLPSELKIEIEGIKIHAYHATPNSLFDVVSSDESEEKLMKTQIVQDADLYVYAHIHKPYIRYLKGKCIINTGSVGLPFDGLNKASYAVVEVNSGNFHTSIIRVEYDVNKVINQFRESDYPNKDFMINLLQKAKI